MLSKLDFAQRRQALLDKMLPNSIAILPTAPVYHRSADQSHHFYPDNDFYYFTGFPEPEAVAIISKDATGKNQYILFNRKRDPLMEQWNGHRYGQEGAKEHFSSDEAYPYDDFQDKLYPFLIGKENLYVTLGRYPEFDETIVSSLNQLRKKVREGECIPDHIHNLEQMVFEMRLIKSPAEIKVLQKAIDISIDGHYRAMRVCAPGLNEYQIRAELIYEFYKQGGSGEAYESIVAGGANSCILHYVENNQPLVDGEVLLIDAGAKYDFYSGDITRTFPINGKFSPEQKALYEIVLAAQKAAIAEVKPGNPWNKMRDAAERILTEGLVEIGLLHGDINNLIETRAFMPFYMHKIGHWLGMDVHDVGRYKENGEWRLLQTGMVTTIEPGLYIKPGLDVDKKWWGIGIRIEDNVLVTETGHEVLSARLIKEIDDIENFMAKK